PGRLWSGGTVELAFREAPMSVIAALSANTMSSLPRPLPRWLTGKPFYGSVDERGRVLVRRSSYSTSYQWASWLDATVEPLQRGSRLMGRFRLSYWGLFFTALWLAVGSLLAVGGLLALLHVGPEVARPEELMVAAGMVGLFVVARFIARRQEPKVVASILSLRKATGQL